MGFDNHGAEYVLTSPKKMPNACGFLWNKGMMIQASCRGFASAQFMQPEPSKYVAGPMLEAKSFMQPEQPYFAHHPGRFFYIKNRQTNQHWSMPYEPVRASYEQFEFRIEQAALNWTSCREGIHAKQTLTLSADDNLELWTFELSNQSASEQSVSVYPYFPVGYRSWMNQSGSYDQALNGIICSNITPYQKVEQYYQLKDLHELTYLLADTQPDAWETRQHVFEGEGGLHNPDGIQSEQLSNGSANYCIPAATMQYNFDLKPGERRRLRFAFGPAKNNAQIERIKTQLFGSEKDNWEAQSERYAAYLGRAKGCLNVASPDQDFDHFVNYWLPRQVFYHGDVNRLCTDPQTRNYLQDNMGLSYLNPAKSKQAFLTAMSQQKSSGQMPDGVLLNELAELKYINQVPHTDHCVWLPICLQAYLQETGDYDMLQATVPYADDEAPEPLFEHLDKAMQWLLQARDERGLSLIEQGDWCDPMNMVGHKGKGVSAWLTLASAYAFKIWSDICSELGQQSHCKFWQQKNQMLNQLSNQYFWQSGWYARGITDEGRLFGTENDKEGKIFLNPQSWALLSGACEGSKIPEVTSAISTHLDTPYGLMMLAPSYTSMVEDIGRVTQKFPGTAENGSVYNHATAFYIFSLFELGRSDEAFVLLKKMLPSPSDMVRRGQPPIFIPNYYRGAYHQYPDEAGRSSQLFNTGTVAWYYRSVIEQLFGLKGCKQGLRIMPNIPESWPYAQVTRQFRGAEVNVSMARTHSVNRTCVWCDGIRLQDNVLIDIQAGKTYDVTVELPFNGNKIR